MQRSALLIGIIEDVRNTQATVKPHLETHYSGFPKRESMGATLGRLLRGKQFFDTDPRALDIPAHRRIPAPRVARTPVDGRYYSCDNRRLFMLRVLEVDTRSIPLLRVAKSDWFKKGW